MHGRLIDHSYVTRWCVKMQFSLTEERKVLDDSANFVGKMRKSLSVHLLKVLFGPA